MFANISNHPSREWTEAQRSACEALGGEIVDFAFPNVDPEWSSWQVNEIGQDLAERVAGVGVRAALVQGEFTLTWVLVRELRNRGIRCFAAATARNSEVDRTEDGTTLRRSVYRFVRMREYPD